MGRKKKVVRVPGTNKDGTPDKRFKAEVAAVTPAIEKAIEIYQIRNVSDLLKELNSHIGKITVFRDALDSVVKMIK